jgi:PPE-repeat protein
VQADQFSSETGSMPASTAPESRAGPAAASPATAMDFGAPPPEITSGLMHSGPGAESMLRAATAWDEITDQLDNVAAGYYGVTSNPASGSQDPALRVTAQAFASYVAWLKATAAQARQAALQAKAAAGAYVSAVAAVVSPQAIEFNRQRRLSLAAMNFLGHTTAAIAGIEAEYEQMWAQNADAMLAYARSSAEASILTPFNSPPRATGSIAPAHTESSSRRWLRTTAPDVISTGRQVMSAITEALRAIFLSPLTTCDASLSPVTGALSKLSSLSAPTDSALNYLNYLNKTAAINNAAAIWSPRSPTGRAAHVALQTGFGRAESVGVLSVPPAWVQSRPTWVDPQAGPLDQLQ